MADTLSDIFGRMLGRLQILVEKYNALKAYNQQLNEEKSALEKEIQRQKKEIEVLTMENHYLRIARISAPDKESIAKSRELVAKLVRDVEKCIEQLNEQFVHYQDKCNAAFGGAGKNLISIDFRLFRRKHRLVVIF